MKKFLILINLLFASCVGGFSSKESPMIYFSNASPKMIKNIRCDWAGNILTLPYLDPGDSRSQSFYIGGPSDFFGLVKVSWNNENGKKIERDFYFQENNMPNFSDDANYNYVQFYFDQADFEIISSDSPNLSGKTQKMNRILKIYHNQYANGHKPTHHSLIDVKPVKDTSLPGWLVNTY